MAGPVATTTKTSSSNYATSRYSEMIQKALIEVGPNEYVFRSATESGAMKGVTGHSNQLKVNRNRRIPIPMAAVSAEGTPPTPTLLEIDNTTGTADQYVLSVQFTDVAEIYAFNDLLSQAIGAVKDAMKRLDEYVCSIPFLAATNIHYPNAKTSRADLVAADTINSDMLDTMSAALRRGPNVYGPATPYQGGNFLTLIHDWLTRDLRKDPTFVTAETRAGNSKLWEKGIIASAWAGTDFKRSNWIPEYYNMATGMASLVINVGADTVYGTAVSDSTADASLNGFRIKSDTASGTFTTATYDFRVVARNKLRGFAENISSTLTYVCPTTTTNLTVQMPDSTNYWYDLYQGDSGGTLYRVAVNQEGDAEVNLTAPAVAGTVAPIPPAVGLTVIPFFMCGMGAVKAVDLRGLETFITPKVSTHEDVAQQLRTIGAKIFEGAFLQQNEWIRKGEAVTGFAPGNPVA